MLTLQFVPYSDIEELNSQERVNKLLDLVKEEKIVLMQGRLRPEEETLLIQQTMQEIKDDFTGIELCTIFPEEKDLQLFKRIKKGMVQALVGNRDGITLVGPASIVKEIKRDLNKIQLYMHFPGQQGKKKTKKARSTAKRKR